MNRASRLTVLVLLAALVAAGCVPGNDDAEPFEGRWRSEGYGLYLDVSGGIDVYEHTSVSCALVAGGSGRGSSDVLSLDGDRLLLTEGGVTIAFDRVEALPARCADPFGSDDPAEVMAVLVATMSEQYAAFDLRDPGWPGQAASAAAEIAPDIDEAGLLAAMQDLLGPLGDAQVRLSGPGPGLLPGGTWSADEISDEVAGLAGRIREGVIPGLTDPQTALDGAVVWGRLAGGHGYLAVTRLAGFAEDRAVEEQLLAEAIDEALGSLIGAPALVIDLRTNRGGRESLALLVASRFVAADTVVATREVRIGGTDRYSGQGEVVVRPLPAGPYPAPAAVLTGPATAGAAELLVLALRKAGAVLVGEPTAGSLSPLLVRILPNGWNLGLSHQRVLDADGVLWEAVGIPVDLVATAEPTADRDPVIEAGASASE